MAKFFLNGDAIDFTAGDDVPLLWAIRDWFGLTGTKYGCGMAQCGACTVHVDGNPTRSCITPVSAVQGKRVVTIEYLPSTTQGATYRAVSIKGAVPQGYISGEKAKAACINAGKRLCNNTEWLRAC